jgi:hypothetical protein
MGRLDLTCTVPPVVRAQHDLRVAGDDHARERGDAQGVAVQVEAKEKQTLKPS